MGGAMLFKDVYTWSNDTQNDPKEKEQFFESQLSGVGLIKLNYCLLDTEIIY